MKYFKPRLYLGMTATPDKRDDRQGGMSIYELFNYEIACEIRLNDALENDLLCPFHYFGISDIGIVVESFQLFVGYIVCLDVIVELLLLLYHAPKNLLLICLRA